jgi:hypothetical protein
VFHAGKAIPRNGPPFAVGTNPELGMHLILWDHFAAKDVTHKKVIVHGVGDNLGYRGGVELEKTVMLRLTGLDREV